MNKSFIKSITAAVAGLSVMASCSHLGLGKDSHKCGAGKKMEDSHKCGAANGCAAKKGAKAEKKAAVKTETKKN